MCGIQDEHSPHVALIYADTIKLKSIDCMISTENRSDSFFAPRPTVLMSSNLEDVELQFVSVHGPCLLLASSVFPFSSWEQGGDQNIYKRIAGQPVANIACCLMNWACVYTLSRSRRKNEKATKSAKTWLFDAEEEKPTFG